MACDPERTPVIAGIGQINDRPEDPGDGLDPVHLMADALKLADEDAGGGWLGSCDSLAVVAQLAWPQLNPVDGKLAELLGIDPAHRMQTAMPNGDSPILLLHEAANRIGRGEAKICAVTGGEALRTAGRWIGKLRRMSGHFRAGLDEVVRQAEIEEMAAANAVDPTLEPGEIPADML